MDNFNYQPLSQLERLACRLTLTDPDLLSCVPKDERFHVVKDLFALILVAIWQMVTWTVSLGSYGLPLSFVIALAVLITAMVVKLEISLTATSTMTRGIVAKRLAIGLLFAAVNSLGFDLALLKGETTALMEEQRTAKNTAVMTSYDEKIASIRAEFLGGSQQIELARDDLLLRRQQLAVDRGRLEGEIERLNLLANEAELEASRQKNGMFGRVEGEGRHYRDAVLRREQAMASTTLLRGKLLELNGREVLDETKLAKVDEQLAAVNQRVDTKIAELKVERDGVILPRWDGPIWRLRAFLELKSDPERGMAVTVVMLGSFLFVLALDLLFLLVRSSNRRSLYAEMWESRFEEMSAPHLLQRFETEISIAALQRSDVRDETEKAFAEVQIAVAPLHAVNRFVDVQSKVELNVKAAAQRSPSQSSAIWTAYAEATRQAFERMLRPNQSTAPAE